VIIHRRGFLLGLSALVTAPAIVAYDRLMPIRSISRLFSGPPLELVGVDGVVEQLKVLDLVSQYHQQELLDKILASQIVYVR
jgi:hypothetical protein